MTDISQHNLFIDGKVLVGNSVTEKFNNACTNTSNILRTSFGPLGLDKMCIDPSNNILITNDGATILTNTTNGNDFDIISQFLSNISNQQDKEIGDGTTSVTLLATSLYSKAVNLLSLNVSPRVIINGYRMALKESIRFIKQKLELPLQSSQLNNLIRTTISSKLINSAAEYFIPLIAKASKTLENYEVEEIPILKKEGKGINDSTLLQGYAINVTPIYNLNKFSQNSGNKKIILIDFNLKKTKLPLTTHIVIENPDELESIRMKEISQLKNKVMTLIKTGVDIIFSSKGIDDIGITLFREHEVMFVRRVRIEDLKVLSRLTKSPIYTDIIGIGDSEANQNISSDDFNNFTILPTTVNSVKQISAGENELMVVEPINNIMISYLLRGPNEAVLEEIHRNLLDSLHSVKSLTKRDRIVAGGGATELALSLFLQDFSSAISTKEFLPIHRFAEALLVIPKTLISNSGLNSTEILSKMVSKMQNSVKNKNESDIQKGNKQEQSNKYFGFDCLTGKIQNNIENGIIEPSSLKIKVLSIATEAVCNMINVDSIVILNKEKKRERTEC
ncbi:hypothetical protein LUQ84_3589 [Hamiltosporidium tvaerminnensis]|nr:hypothetical protein LUQ84_3589 [Hamiltosporidium tvaerminnensis]